MILTPTRKKILVAAFIGLWAVLHIPAIMYGTSNLPLHSTYIGDEQAPIYGALHMLRERSVLGLRNETSAYYGPIFSLLVLPAVAGDALLKTYITKDIATLIEYADYIVWDWGGIIILARILTVAIGLVGVWGVYRLFSTRSFNPHAEHWLPGVASAYFAFGFLYFEYASFLKHWIPIIALFVWQMYMLVRLLEEDGRERKRWYILAALSVLSFGISYLPALFQAFWVAPLLAWFVEKRWSQLLMFGRYAFLTGLGYAAIILWHPYAFFRFLGQVGIIETGHPLDSVLDITTLNGYANSFGSYAELLLIHSFPAMFLIPIGFLVLARRKKLLNNLSIWMLVVPACIYYVVFSLPAQHVSRYMLPVIVCLAFLSLLAWRALRYELGPGHWSVRAGTALLVCSFILNIYYAGGWIHMVRAGPVEEEVIERILATQQENPTARTMVRQSSILGHPHTREAYESFVNDNRSQYQLWKHVLTHEPPADVTPLNAFYLSDEKEYTDEELRGFDLVFTPHIKLTQAAGTMDTRDDVFDFKPWKTYGFREYRTEYEVVEQEEIP